MQLDYFTLLSEEPVKIQNIGSIKSPTINEIKKITYSVYLTYIDYLIMDIPSYFSMLEKNIENYPNNQEIKDTVSQLKNDYIELSEEDKSKLSILDIIKNDEYFIQILSLAFNFFFVEDVIFNHENACFYLYDGSVDDSDEKVPTGIIFSGNYTAVTDLILSRVNVKRKNNKENKMKFKNKKAAELYAKMHPEEEKETKEDKRFELANIISSLSIHSKNLNLIDIGNLTVFQVYDQFQKQQIEDYYELMKRSVSIWGDSDNKFDVLGWLKLNNED